MADPSGQHLLERLRDAERRAGKAEQRAEEEQRARRQAEERAGQEHRSRQQAEQRAAEEQARNQPTTFSEYLEAYHLYLSKPLTIQTDRSLTTKGSITNPQGKRCPTYLRPWDDFPDIQQPLFDEVYQLFESSAEAPRLFSSKVALEDLGRRLCRRPLASESDLGSYQRFAVEDHVADIISRLVDIPHARESFSLENGILFENHANTLSDDAEEVQQRSQRRTRPDQICVYQAQNEQRKLLLLVEYKPAHKLSVEYLRAGLRPMDLWREVVQRATIPSDPGEKLNYNADRLVGSAMTQTYSYMLENGLEYSYLTTGEAFVFLQIRKDDPSSLYYHLAEPNREADAQDEYGFRYPLTAVGRVLSLCLMAFNSIMRNQEWRSRTATQVREWNCDFEDVVHEIPADERHLTPPASVYKGPRFPINPRSLYYLRARQRNRETCSTVDILPDDSQDSAEDSGADAALDSPSRRASERKRKRLSSGVQPCQDGRQKGNLSSQYCTQRCLVGLLRQGALDERCPNVRSHRRGKSIDRHQITRPTLTRLVEQQLKHDLDHNCEPLGKQGARGALFKITLASYGYTFVGKGTVQAFIPDLLHEAQVYRRLRPIQGSVIPVYLGSIDMAKIRKMYYLDFKVRIVHFLLMSWGGDVATHSQDLEREIQRSETEVRQRGVVHGDVRGPNILWSTELHRAMLVDFERSAILDQGRDKRKCETLHNVSPNKRRAHASATP